MLTEEDHIRAKNCLYACLPILMRDALKLFTHTKKRLIAL